MNNHLKRLLEVTARFSSQGSVRQHGGYRPRRALMYVPGDDLRKLTKAFTLDVDCIAMDCEDGVAINKKSEARSTIKQLLDGGKPSKLRSYDLGVRINSVETDFFKDDLSVITSAKHLPDTILLPKVESPAHLKEFSELINPLIGSRSKVDLIIYIETALAFVNLANICRVAAELSQTSKFTAAGLVFGSDDLCANIGATRTENSIEILYARQKMVLVAKAFGLQAIDMVHIKYKDLEGLRKGAEEGARMGYTGKQVIHPSQVPVVQEAFLPNKKQVDWASGLLEAFEQHQNSGKGAFTYKGAMIDMPTMKQAQNVMNLIKITGN